MDEEEIHWKSRVNASQETHRLIKAIEVLKKTDFDLSTGSGIMISLTPITEGKTLCDEFMMAAEDIEFIKQAICDSLVRSLRLRLSLRRAEVTALERITSENP